MNRAGYENTGRHDDAPATLSVASLNGFADGFGVVGIAAGECAVVRDLEVARWKFRRLNACENRGHSLPAGDASSRVALLCGGRRSFNHADRTRRLKHSKQEHYCGE